MVTLLTIPHLKFLFEKHLVIEARAKVDPLKLICGVLKYACQKKHRMRRSAFTYGEQFPSHLAQAKQRYDGPYTSEQVEDVKSFWRVLIVILFAISFSLNHYSHVTKPLLQISSFENRMLTFLETGILNYLQFFRTGAIVIAALFFQIVYTPLLPRYIPSMLQRVWIGLALMTMSNWLGSTTSIVVVKGLNATNLCLTDDEVAYSSLNNSLFYTTIYINALLNGIGMSLSFTASLEFIMVQAPLQMQGLIIGFWYGRLAVYAIIKVVGSTVLGCYFM